MAGIIFLRPVAVALGAEGEMVDDCVLYGRIILCALTAFILQNEFQSFFVAAPYAATPSSPANFINCAL